MLLAIQVNYNNKTFNFEFGSEVYIFHTGLYKDMDKKHGIKGLLKYVSKVQECYLSDSNRTPLGELADYVAENWKDMKNTCISEILEQFYENEY